jgi:hypothetical protein
MAEQTKQLQAVLVGHALMGCRQPPARPQGFAIITTQGNVGVSDIDRQQHMLFLVPKLLNDLIAKLAKFQTPSPDLKRNYRGHH